MIKNFKIMLIPNNKQKTKLFLYANTARFAYNWAVGKQQENYKNGGKFIKDNDLRKELTQLKKTEEYLWLNNISNNVTKQAIKDACNSYKKFFKGLTKYPRFKSKKTSKPSFYQDPCKIKFTSTHIKVEGFASSTKKNKQKLNWIKLAEHNRVPINVKYYNPRFVFDGINWYVTVGIDFEHKPKINNNNGIGIDLGIKDLAICSDGNIYKNINKTLKIKKLEKKRRRLQRQISRKYIMNKKGGSYCKTRNIIKSELKLLKINHRLKNIRHNYQLQVINEIINRKPMFIVLENLNVMGMMKNKNLSKSIQEQSLYSFYRQIQYKCLCNNIKFIEASRWYPSSKTCSKCGNIKKQLKLSERKYVCEECGIKIDRDLNASINLMKYGLQLVI